MGDNTKVAWRYGVYAIVLIAALAIYLWLGEDNSIPSGGARHNQVELETLPALRFLDHDDRSGPLRDLFSFVSPVQNHAEKLAPKPVEVESNPRRFDALAALNVIGLVHRADSMVILVQLGSNIRSVTLGERFGDDDALSVLSVEGRHVVVVDNLTNVSRTFALSEE